MAESANFRIMFGLGFDACSREISDKVESSLVAGKSESRGLLSNAEAGVIIKMNAAAQCLLNLQGVSSSFAYDLKQALKDWEDLSAKRGIQVSKGRGGLNALFGLTWRKD